MAETGQRWRFGAFELDSRTRELSKADGTSKLQEQPFQFLSALLERRGEVVTRDELRRRVWPDNTFVDFDNGLNVAIAKLRNALNDDPDKPVYIETVPRVGYRFIAQAQLLPAQSGGIAAISARESQRVIIVWASIATAIAAGLVLAIFALRPLPESPSIKQRPAVAIMGFRNLTAKPDQEWVSTALSEMFATELAAGEHLRIIPGESAARAKLDMALPDAESYSEVTLAKIRRRLGADYVLVGSYLESGAPSHNVRLDLRLQDAKTGETIATLPANGSQDDLGSLVAEAGLALRHTLAAGSVSQAEASGVRAALPPNSDSARLYAEGLNRLRHFDALGARDLLGQAVTVDPNYALAHAALSDAWSALGYAEIARNEAQRAWELSSQLPPADRLSIEARYRETTSEWDQASRIYRRLAEHFPDNADYGLRLAAAQTNAGKANEALVTLENLRKRPVALADEGAIRFAESQAAEKLGDFERAQAAATAAAGLAHARGAQILEADARALECRQLVQLSRLGQAESACETAREIYARTGDHLGLAASMAYLAAAYCNQGNAAEARRLYTQALDINREIGNARSDAQWALNGLAVLLMQQGDLASARRLYEESLGMARMVGSRPDEASALGNIASMWLREGDLKRARELSEQALQRSRSIGAKAEIASALNNLGQTLYQLGDLPEAARMLGQAVETDRETGSTLESADALSWLGRVRMAQGNWVEARRSFEESVQTCNSIRGQMFAAQYRLAGAELALALGKPAEAEGPIRDGLAVSRRAKALDRELEAQVLLAHALLDQGKVEQASRELTAAEPLARATQQPAQRLAFAIVAARVQAASAHPSDVDRAKRALQAAAADAESHGFLGYQFEARLTLAQIEYRQAESAGARELEKLEKDARASGFRAIARRAADALKKPGRLALNPRKMADS
ncbi:MAG TPA: tetratricopeptide repeat protein [Bryobacteraceae bacterium]|nr:tetratricopeptide repeat protein [Bryobacteraceae bacterium]